jgi:hypothetical protein
MKRSSEPRKTANLSESLHQQLNMYALAASAAGVSVLSLAQPAEAKIVYTNAHVALQNPASFALDLNHDGIIDFYLDLHRAIRGRSHSASFLSICHRLSFSNCESFNSSTAPNALNAIEIVANRYYRFKATALHAGAEIQSKARFRNKKAVLMGAGEFYATSQGRTSTQWIAPLGQWWQRCQESLSRFEIQDQRKISFWLGTTYGHNGKEWFHGRPDWLRLRDHPRKSDSRRRDSRCGRYGQKHRTIESCSSHRTHSRTCRAGCASNGSTRTVDLATKGVDCR